MIAASLVGPRTVGRMIAALVAMGETLAAATPGGYSGSGSWDKYHELMRRISRTRPTSFGPAVLGKASTTSLLVIRLLAQLIARHGDDEARKSPFLADGEITRALVASAHQWVDTLLSTSESKRHEFADVAMAIGRLGQPELVADLQWLLDEDLLRWRQSRDALRDARARGVFADMSDAAHSYVLQYRQAFAAIGGDQIVELMTAYLEDRDFGFGAACVLKAVWDRAQDAPAPSPFKSWPDFSEVKARRSRRAADALAPACPAAEAIFGAIERLVRPEGNSDAQLLAVKLGKIAVSMPYGNKEGIIGALLALPQPVRTKRELLAALMLAGEVVNADTVLEGVRACIDAEVNHSWMTDQEWWEVERWLELLPFTDRPTATGDGLAIVNAVMSHPRRMDHVVSALRMRRVRKRRGCSNSWSGGCRSL
jgi:hypothetical protein